MKKQSENLTDAALLRQKAEEKLKLRKSQTNKTVSEADKLKLIHELEVHQIELEMQNEELVTAKEKAELAEEKYTSLFDFAPTAYFNLTPDGNISELNLAGAKMLGKERRNLVNSRLALFISSNTRAVFNDFVSQVLIGKSPASCEVTFANGGDAPIYAHLSGTVADDGKNCLITAFEITRSKMAEKALKESEERYALVIDASEQGIWDWNIETNEVFYSKQWKRQIGYEDHEIENDFSSWIEHLHPDEKEACQNAVKSYLINPVEHFVHEFKFRHKDGSYRWIYNKASSILNNYGKVVRMFGAHTDITDHKQFEIQIKFQNEELRKLNATKDKFFSIIAHDLKSSFNSIIGFSELLVVLISNKNYDGIKKYAGIILQSSWRVMNLLMNLMEWSRSQTGRMKFNPEQFNLSVFIHDITLLFDDIAGQKGIIIKKELSPNMLVFADQSMISTVLRNLTSNAIKFTKPGGEIILAVTKEKSKLTVSVKDNGIGIPNDNIEKLFRIDENFTTHGTANETGTGLGLMLCKEFMEKHDEKIWVESTEGKGSAFYFTLPCCAEPRAETIDQQLAT